MKFKPVLIASVVFVVVSLVVFLGVILFTGQNTKVQEPIDISLNLETLDVRGELTGYIFSSGLPDAENPRFQITYLNSSASVVSPDSIKGILEGAYIIDTTSQVINYWGKCVRIVGNFNASTTKEDVEYNYYRATISLISITPSTECNIVLDESPGYELVLKSYTGTLLQATRPAPDINYDFLLQLTNPYTDKNNPSGLEQTVSDIYLVPISIEAFNILNDNINKQVEVSGEWMAGFSESNFLLTSDIKLLND